MNIEPNTIALDSDFIDLDAFDRLVAEYEAGVCLLGEDASAEAYALRMLSEAESKAAAIFKEQQQKAITVEPKTIRVSRNRFGVRPFHPVGNPKGKYSKVQCMSMEPWSLTVDELDAALRNVVASTEKDGPYFLQAMGTQRTNDAVEDNAALLIIDGDKRIDDTGELVDGAPDPKRVHDALKQAGVNHTLVSTFTNAAPYTEELHEAGIAKDDYAARREVPEYHRYRIVIPCEFSQKQHKAALLEYVMETLHAAGVMLYDSGENHRASQAFYYGRVLFKSSFYFASWHEGDALDVDGIYNAWLAKQGDKATRTHDTQSNANTGGSTMAKCIALFDDLHDVEEILELAGYEQHGDRWLHPGNSSGLAGVNILVRDGRRVVCSHNESDPLYKIGGNGKHFVYDAFDCYRILMCDGGYQQAVAYNAEVQALYDELRTASDDDFETLGLGSSSDHTKATKPQRVDLPSLFDDLTLSQEHVDKMANTRFLIPNVITHGHVSLYAAPANGGKSALFRYFCEKLCADGMKVIYINVDAGPGDLKKHYAHAKEHGYQIIAPDAHVGKSADDVTKKLTMLADSGESCDKYVFILDTLKKFTDVINKAKAKEFYALLRKLSVNGATVCLLGHCNKYKDADGKHVYEGTADLRNDIDNLIYFDSSLNEQTNRLEVTTRPDKIRATFHPVSFSIDKNNGLKVTEVDKVINIIPDEDREILEVAKLAIGDGFTSQGEIVEYVKARIDGVGDKKIKSRLKFYSSGPNPELSESQTGIGRGLRYEVIW